MGPMATAGQLKVVEEHIADARAKGAVIPVGGGRVAGLAGHFIEPTVLTGVDHTMLVHDRGDLRPDAARSWPSTATSEAVALANDSVYGLTASVWTRDRKRAAWFADRLEAGSVTVNDHMYSFCEPRAIWGGIKQTGMGRSHGPYGLHELVNIKHVGTDFFRKKSQTWWFPYDAQPRRDHGEGDRDLPQRGAPGEDAGRPGAAQGMAADRGDRSPAELRPGPAEDPEKMRTPPRLIGLTGTNGAGKGEAAAFFMARGYAYFSLSDVIRDELRDRGEAREPGQPHPDGERAAGALRPRRPGPADDGQGRGGGPAVIDSIRNTAEVAFLRRQDGFVLLAIDAPGRGALRPRRGPGPGRVGRATSRPSGRRRTRSGRAERRPSSSRPAWPRPTGSSSTTAPSRNSTASSRRSHDAAAEIQGPLLSGHRQGGLAAEHLLPAGHRGHHRPRRPDHLDGLRRRAAQDPGQPGARLLPAGPAGHPPRPALRALPERPRRAERHHQRRPGRGQPARGGHVHLRQRAGRRARRSAPSPATSARRC